jgi:hypothetical protein
VLIAYKSFNVDVVDISGGSLTKFTILHSYGAKIAQAAPTGRSN